MEAAAIALARSGEQGALWIALAGTAALLDAPRRRLHLRAAAVVAGTLGLNYAVKLAVRRRRPQLEDLPPLTSPLSGLSYPSAHAATSFAAARALSPALPRVPLYAGAAAMALTRPYLGAHYPSDIVAGAAFGDALARLAQ